MSQNKSRFTHKFTKLVQKEHESSSKLDSFNLLLRRSIDICDTVNCKFRISLDELKCKKTLFVDKILFTNDIPWTVYLSPRFLIGIPSYDLIIKCLLPPITFAKDSKVSAVVKFSGPSPFSTVIKTQNFGVEDVFTIRSCVTVEKLSKVMKKKTSQCEFEVEIRIKSDNAMRHLDLNLPAFQPAQNLDEALVVKKLITDKLPALWYSSWNIDITSQWDQDVCSALIHILSEESMRVTTAKTWYETLEFLCSVFGKLRELVFNSGYLTDSEFLDHIVKLMRADFSEGPFSHLIPGLLTSFFTWDWNSLPNINKKTMSLISTTARAAHNVLCVGLIRDKKTGPRLMSRLLLDIQPSLIANILCLDDLDAMVVLDEVATSLLEILEITDTFNCYKFGSFLDIEDSIKFYRTTKPADQVIEKLWKFHDDFLSTPEEFRYRRHFDKPIFMTVYAAVATKRLTNPYSNLICTSSNVHFDNSYLVNIIDLIDSEKRAGHEMSRYLNDIHPLMIYDFVVPSHTSVSLLRKLVKAHKRHANDKTISVQDKRYLETMRVLDNFLSVQCYEGYKREDLPCTLRIKYFKEHGIELYKAKDYLGAAEEFSVAINASLAITELYTKSDEVCYEIQDLLNTSRTNRAGSYLGAGLYQEALADATIALIELGQTASDFLEGEMDAVLIERALKLRFRRAKALVGLEQGGPALCNILFVIKSGKFREVALKVYYKALISFLKTQNIPQYPHFCVMCCDSEMMKTFSHLKERCTVCRHPYCSDTCKDTDKTLHKEHCTQLRDAYREARRHMRDMSQSRVPQCGS